MSESHRRPPNWEEIARHNDQLDRLQSRNEKQERMSAEYEAFEVDVRVIVLRSKSTQTVRQEMVALRPGEPFHKNVADLSFTTMIMMERDETPDHPQELLAPGGKIKEKETIRAAAARTLLNKTHLQPVGMSLAGEMDFVPKKKNDADKKVHVNVEYVIADVSPYDNPLSLDPEHGVAKFHQLDLTKSAELMVHGKQTLAADQNALERVATLYESLLTASALNQNGKVDKPKEEEITRMQKKIMDELQKKELLKKKQVFTHMAHIAGRSGWFKKGGVVTESSWIDGFKNAETMYEMFSILSEFCGIYNSREDFNKVFIEAYDLSNFEEEVSFDDTKEVNPLGKSQIEAILHFMYVQLEAENWSDDYLKIAKRNPQIKEYVERFEQFLQEATGGGMGAVDESYSDDDKPRQQLATKQEIFDDMDRNEEKAQKVEEAFVRAFDLGSVPEADARLSDIDALMQHIATNIMKPRTGHAHHHTTVDEFEAVKGFNLRDLIIIAFPNESERFARLKEIYKDPKKPEDKEGITKLVLEARRKIAALYLLHKGDKKYDEAVKVVKRGEIEKSVYEPLYRGIVNREVAYVKDGGTIINIVPAEENRVGGEISTKKTKLRIIEGASGTKICVEVKGSPKDRTSFQIKQIIRGYEPEQIHDVFRRAIAIVEPYNEHPDSVETKRLFERMIERVPVQAARWEGDHFNADDLASGCLPLYSTNKEKKILPAGRRDYINEDSTEVTEAQCVLDLLKAIAQRPGVRIFDFKPTPLAGERLKSSGPGKGGDVRLAKWYVEHTDAKGTIRYEEVQVYSPTKEKGALYFLKIKEDDDADYALDRIFEVNKGARRSGIEMMFPEGVYNQSLIDAQKKSVAASKGRKNGH